MCSPKTFPVPTMREDDLDWIYNMRRDMQEIVPGLFLGPYASANKTKLAHLKSKGITHIVCIRHKCEAPFVRPNFPEHFQYLVLEISDTVTENIICYFPTVQEFIHQALSAGGKVLVHGNAGISRSASLVIAYVMETYKTSYNEAFDFVQQKRFCIYPNEGFARQLKEYEPIYQARMQCQCNGWSSHTGDLKRKAEEENEEEPMH